MAVIITVGIEDLLAEGTLEPCIGSGFSTQLILVGPVSTHGLQHLGGRARERVLLHGQALPSRGSHRVAFTLHRTEQLFVPSTVCEVTHPSYLVPRGREGVWYQR